LKKLVIRLLAVVVIGAVLIQLAPYGRDHDNPPVINEPEWSSESDRALVARACFDCHSNETEWPWYSNIAPVSWWTQNHVDEGRDELNFSEWSWDYDELDEIAESVMEGEMPPGYYENGPRSPNLTSWEREQLIWALVNTFGYTENGRQDDD